MSNCNCNSHSCGHTHHWGACGSGCNACGSVLGSTIGCGCNTCGCVAGDGTPACNPWAPWGRVAGTTTCGCNRCSNWGCSACQSCSGCGSVAGDSTCSGCQCGDCGSTAANGGYLIPRYVSIGRTFQRRITQTLCVDDIPDCAESPLTLVGVTVSGQAAWEQISECRQQLLRVTVPVSVQVRDCSGRCRTGHATVTLTIPLCWNCSQQDFWRGQLYVAPCIRLAAPVTENEDGCFDATLEVAAEVYLVRLQAFSG